MFNSENGLATLDQVCAFTRLQTDLSTNLAVDSCVVPLGTRQHSVTPR